MSILTASTIALFDPATPGVPAVDSLRAAASCQWVILAYVALLSWLMVCELPMFSLKFHNLGWKGNEPKYILIGLAAVLLATLRLAAVPLIILLFILMSVGLWAAGRRK